MKRKFAKKRAFEIALLTLAAANLAGILLAGEDPRLREAMWAALPFLQFTSPYSAAWNKVIYDLSLASLVSLFFYWLIVWLPDRRKRARLKHSFRSEYKSFRLDCIEYFLLMADKSYDAGLPETLLTQSAFRNYFKGEVIDGQDRWQRVANRLDEYYLTQIVSRMESFREEIVFVMNNVDIESEEALAFVKQLSKEIRAATITVRGYDNGRFLGFLWAVFTGWSFVSGYPPTDIVEDMIREL